MEYPRVILWSVERRPCIVYVKAAMMSTSIKMLLIRLGSSADMQQIPVNNVRWYILDLAMQWAHMHCNDPPSDEDARDRRTDNISAWDQFFFGQLEPADLFELILAATDLDIPGLVDATSKTVANMIKGKNSQQLRHVFNIRNDFTQAERSQIRRETRAATLREY